MNKNTKDVIAGVKTVVNILKIIVEFEERKRKKDVQSHRK